MNLYIVGHSISFSYNAVFFSLEKAQNFVEEIIDQKPYLKQRSDWKIIMVKEGQTFEGDIYELNDTNLFAFSDDNKN